MSDIIYEVYVFHDYRWQLEKQFDGAQHKARAVEYAEHVYREKHILAYKVMEERTDPATGEVRSKKVSNKKKVDELPKRPPPKPAAQSGGGASRPAARGSTPAAVAAAAAGAKPTQAEDAASLTDRGQLAIRILMFSLGLAVVTLFLAVLAGIGLVAVTGTLMLVAGSGFLASAALGIGLLANAPEERARVMRILSHLLSERVRKAEPEPPPAPVVAPAPVAAPAPPPPPPAAAPDPAMILLDPDEPESAVTPERRDNLLTMVQGFATIGRGWIVQLLKIPNAAENNQITAHMRFGLHLFLAGLCEQARKLKQWNYYEFAYVLRHSLDDLFNDPSNARRFVQNYSEYLTESRYAEMFQAGLNWDGKFSEGMPASIGLVQRWLNKSDGAPVPDVTVVFTDIIGSTEFTQRHGDKIQMELVQAHDRIVRQAVEDHHGRWVKHTGDGGMLAFDKAIDAVRAAAQMQNEVRVHNSIMPHLPLHLRVGLSSGQPIKAGEDLFGSTVQLAARVCALANAGQVIVSRQTQAACADSGFSFTDLGTKELKGFPEPQQVFALSLGS